MKTNILMLLLLSALGLVKAKAQNQLKGEVFAQASRKPINQAEIINLNT